MAKRRKVGMCATAGTVSVLTDGNVLVAGELPRQRPRWRRAHFDGRSALRAQSGLFGEGRHWDDDADRFPIRFVLPDQSGRDVPVADGCLRVVIRESG
jgi:hypothetical protein